MTKTKNDRVAIAAEVSMNQFSDIRKHRVKLDFPLASLFEVENGSCCSSQGKSGVKYNPPIPLAFAITIIVGKGDGLYKKPYRGMKGSLVRFERLINEKLSRTRSAHSG